MKVKMLKTNPKSLVFDRLQLSTPHQRFEFSKMRKNEISKPSVFYRLKGYKRP